MYEYQTEIRRVVDGDTVDLWIDMGVAIELPGQKDIVDLGFNVFIKDGRLTLKDRVRLFGVDTPESRTRDLREKKFGKLATIRVKELLPVGGKFKCRSEEYDAKGKFGRGLFDFELSPGQFLCQLLLDEHHAVPYHGESKAEARPLHEANFDILEAQGL